MDWYSIYYVLNKPAVPLLCLMWTVDCMLEQQEVAEGYRLEQDNTVRVSLLQEVVFPYTGHSDHCLHSHS